MILGGIIYTISATFADGKASKRYTAETLQKALDDIKRGALSVHKASKVYKIPNQTLYDKIKQRHIKQLLPGAPTVLKPNEEASVTKWIVHITDMGFPVTKKMLVHSVSKLVTELDRPLKFKDLRPGRSWYDGFLKRNSALKGRVIKTLISTRVNVTEEETRAWFKQVSRYFKEKDLLEVLEDPSRIFYCDESAYYLGPKGQAVLTRKGAKNEFSKFGYIEKETLTLSIGASADGKLMPTLAIFPCKTIPNIDKYPESWSCGRSDNRWMTADNFYEYISNVFNPVLISENVKKPIVLFLDGHVTYLSLQVTEYCKENGIILIALIPSSNRILHPMDVAIFKDLKEVWREQIHSWRIENNIEGCLIREDFGVILEKCINETLTPEIIQNGFREAGIFPFDENAIDYSKLSHK